MKAITSLLLTAAIAGSLFVGPFASAQTKPAVKPVAAKKTMKAHASRKHRTARKHAMKSSKPTTHKAPGTAAPKK